MEFLRQSLLFQDDETMLQCLREPSSEDVSSSSGLPSPDSDGYRNEMPLSPMHHQDLLELNDRAASFTPPRSDGVTESEGTFSSEKEKHWDALKWSPSSIFPTPTQRAYRQYAYSKMTYVQKAIALIRRNKLLHMQDVKRILYDLLPFVNDNSAVVQEQTAEFFATLVDNGGFETEFLVQHGIVGKLLKHFDRRQLTYKSLMLHMLVCMSQESDFVPELVDQGGFDAVFLCLDEKSPNLVQEALYVIGNMGLDTYFVKTLINEGKGRELCLRLFSHDALVTQWTLAVVAEIAYVHLEFARYMAQIGFLELMEMQFLHNRSEDEKTIELVIIAWEVFSRQSADIAKMIVDLDALPFITESLLSEGVNIRGTCIDCYTQLSKHGLMLAEKVTGFNALGIVMKLLDGAIPEVARRVATLAGSKISDMGYGRYELPITVLAIEVLDIVSNLLRVTYSPLEAHKIAQFIGVAASRGSSIAYKILKHRAYRQLRAIVQNPDSHPSVLGTAVWALGNIGRHNEDLANSVCTRATMDAIVSYASDVEQPARLRELASIALKLLLNSSANIHVLQRYVNRVTGDVLNSILRSITNVISNDERARISFLESGALKNLLQIESELGSDTMEYIIRILEKYPRSVQRKLQGEPTDEELLMKELERLKEFETLGEGGGFDDWITMPGDEEWGEWGEWGPPELSEGEKIGQGSGPDSKEKEINEKESKPNTPKVKIQEPETKTGENPSREGKEKVQGNSIPRAQKVSKEASGGEGQEKKKRESAWSKGKDTKRGTNRVTK